MNVGELMSNLQDLLDAGTVTEDTEIRYAAQPKWPMEYTLSDSVVPVVFTKEEIGEDSGDDRDTM
jgi:hypothetical protein